MRQWSGLLRVLAASAALLLQPAASADTLPEADIREVRTYVLTEAVLGKYVDATRKLSAIPLDCEADERGIDSLSDAAAKIDAMPGAKSAMKAAGLTSREYVVFAFALIENAYAAFSLEQPGGKLPPGISIANVEFLRRHSGVIERLANETEVAGCAEGGGSGGQPLTPARAAEPSTP
ncbi:MAG TPA: hypothetical protein VFR77_05925 [Steroidobacteraceae bacterium]|nr:hypothetical protein [Steroidobacteraceae bacterium]